MKHSVIFNFFLFASFLFLLSCSEEEFNFHFYSETSGTNKKDLVVRGNLSNRDIPHGKFEIFEPGYQQPVAKGEYTNGQKSGLWEFHFENGDTSVVMKEVQFDTFRFSLPSSWLNVKTTPVATVYLSQGVDSIIKSNFSLRLHEKGAEENQDFDGFSKELSSSVESSYFKKKVDYSGQFQKNYEFEKIRFYQYYGSDREGRDLGVLHCLFDDDRGHFVEVAIGGPADDLAFHYRIFTEIILDIQTNGDFLLNRWALKTKS